MYLRHEKSNSTTQLKLQLFHDPSRVTGIGLKTLSHICNFFCTHPKTHVNLVS